MEVPPYPQNTRTSCLAKENQAGFRLSVGNNYDKHFNQRVWLRDCKFDILLLIKVLL